MLLSVFRSLRHRQFRIFYLGQLISLTGTWMQNVAQAWLVYRLSQSSLMLGMVAFAALLPVLLFGLVGGLLADRLPRRRLLVTVQTVAMVQALLLAVLALTGWIEVWHIILLAFVLGMAHAVEMPSRHSLLAELVPAEDLANAIALNASLFNAARFLGPAVAGALVAWLGEGPVFLLNAATFLATIAALKTLSAGVETYSHQRGGRRRELQEGLAYAWQTSGIRSALLMLAAISITAPVYSVLMPVFVDQVYAGGAQLLGLLLGSSGAGALAAAFHLAYLSGRQRLSRHITLAAFATGSGMLLFAWSEQLWLTLPLLAMLGFSTTTMTASVNTLLQMQVPNALRGRIMALFSVLFIGMTSLGNLLAGITANWWGGAVAVGTAGILCLGAALMYRTMRTDP